ncbi:MAG: type VI secretion system contractile sheath large subunit [Acidobacteriota bacterium]
MSGRFSFGNLDLHLSAGSGRSEPIPSSEVPFRIAVLGDFSGQAGREKVRVPPAKLHPVFIDRDNFEDVLQELGVQAHLQLGTSRQRLVLRFESLDDFHPDRILTTLSVFQRLRDMRRKLVNPATFAEAAAEVRKWAGVGDEEARPEEKNQGESESEPEDVELSAGFLLDALKERKAGGRGSAESSDWARMLKELVEPYRIEREDPAQAQLVGYVDAAIGELMEAILHHPEFQALEATWRGVYFLVSQLETGSELKIYLVDLTKKELATDLRSVEDLSRTAIYRKMVEETVQTPGANPWALLAGSYVFGLESDDIESLGRIAKIASAAGAPFVANAGSSLIGCASLASTPDPDDWSVPGETPATQRWEALRRLPEASWLGLILPRFLLRLPYGKRFDPVESFPFEEMGASPEHEHYLWGNPCFVAALLIGRTFSESGWDFSEGIQQDVDGLPVHVYEEAGESIAKPCAEILLTQRAADTIASHGLMPLATMKGEDRVRLLRVESVAEPPSRLAGRWR